MDKKVHVQRAEYDVITFIIIMFHYHALYQQSCLLVTAVISFLNFKSHPIKFKT